MEETAHAAFRTSIHPLFTEPGVKVLIDLSGVPRINSQGIAGMVRLVADANTNGCRVVFAAPTPFVGEVLRVTRLDHYFEVAASQAEAVDLLTQEVG